MKTEKNSAGVHLQFLTNHNDPNNIKWARPYLKNVMDSDGMDDDDVLYFARLIISLRGGTINEKQFQKFVNTYIVKHSKDDCMVAFVNIKNRIKCVSKSRVEEIGTIKKYSCGNHVFHGNIVFTIDSETNMQNTNNVLNSIKEEFLEISKKIETLNAVGANVI